MLRLPEPQVFEREGWVVSTNRDTGMQEYHREDGDTSHWIKRNPYTGEATVVVVVDGEPQDNFSERGWGPEEEQALDRCIMHADFLRDLL